MNTNQNGADQNANNSGANNNGEQQSNNQQQNQNQQQQQQQNNSQQSNSQQQNNQNTGGTGANGKTFTQEDVNRMMAREKNQGRAAAFSELGLDPNDANMMNMFRAFVSAMQSGSEQDNQQSAQQQIKIAEAESRAKKAEAKAEAMQLGVNPQYVDDAVTIIMSKLDDNNDVKTLVGELKTKYPAWFNVEQQNQNDDKGGKQQNNNQQQNQQTGQNGTGSSVGNATNNNNNKGVSGIGTRLAAQRKQGNSQKSSFWS